MGIITDRLKSAFSENDRLTDEMNRRTSAQTQRGLQELRKMGDDTPINSFLTGLTSGLANQYLPSEAKTRRDESEEDKASISELIDTYGIDDPEFYKQLSDYYRLTDRFPEAIDSLNAYKQAIKADEDLRGTGLPPEIKKQDIERARNFATNPNKLFPEGLNFGKDNDASADAFATQLAQDLAIMKERYGNAFKKGLTTEKWQGDSKAYRAILEGYEANNIISPTKDGFFGSSDAIYTPFGTPPEVVDSAVGSTVFEDSAIIDFSNRGGSRLDRRATARLEAEERRRIEEEKLATLPTSVPRGRNRNRLAN